MERKRILLVHQVSTIGGASYCMLSILKALDKCVFEPVVLLRQDGSLADEIRKLGIEVYFLPGMPTVPYNQSLLKIRSVISYVKLGLIQNKFKKILRQLNIDVVYLNNMMLYPYLKSAKEVGCKTILHIREHWPKTEHQKQMERARKYAAKYCDAAIAINQYSASMFPECADRMSIVHDWIDFSERYESRPLEEIFGENTKNLKVIVFTGGLAKIKGTYEVVETFTKQIKGKEYRLLMMGAGFDYKLAGLSGLIKRLMIIVGKKPYGYKVTELIKKDSRIVCIPATYKIVDILNQAYLHLSYFTVPHANLALAEAVVLGTVALAPLTEESLEYSNNGKCAVLYHINDEDELINKFIFIDNNYDEIKEKVLNNSNIVKELFDPSKNIAILNKICTSI